MKAPEQPAPTSGAPPQQALQGRPDTHFFQVAQQVGGVLVDPVGAGSLQFLGAITSREEPDPEGARPLGSKEIPNAVTYDK